MMCKITFLVSCDYPLLPRHLLVSQLLLQNKLDCSLLYPADHAPPAVALVTGLPMYSLCYSTLLIQLHCFICSSDWYMGLCSQTE